MELMRRLHLENPSLGISNFAQIAMDGINIEEEW
jgi:hypothetical protein